MDFQLDFAPAAERNANDVVERASLMPPGRLPFQGKAKPQTRWTIKPEKLRHMAEVVTALSRALCESPHVSMGEFIVQGRLGEPWPVNEHCHEQAQITILTRDNSVCADWISDTGSKRRAKIHGPAVCITPALQPHSMEWNEIGGTMMMMVSAELLEDTNKSVTHVTTAKESYGVSIPALNQIADLLSRTRDAGLPITALYAEAAALRMLECVARAPELMSATQAASCPRIGDVLEFIDAHFARELSLVVLARVARTSPYHFARLFKTSTGTSPHRYVVWRRVQEAKHLLAERDLSIADIAQACGFATQSHLATVFTEYVGVTPRAYRSRVA